MLAKSKVCKLLIIGDMYSQYIENFSLTLNNYDDSLEIDIVNPISIKEIQYEKREPYNKVFSYRPLNPIIAKIPKLRGILTKRKLNKTIDNVNKNIAQYDVILIQGFWLPNCYVFSKLNKQNIFSVGAIWGSDFYKRQENEYKIFSTIDHCDLLVISTQEMVRDVLKVKQVDQSKIRNCFFGLAPLLPLFQLQNITGKESKKILGFNEDDFIIICGYNGSPNLQHHKIISMLSQIGSKLPAKTKVILPITYGGSNEYKMEIKKELKASGLEHVIYENFLSDEKIAHLRKATDLMIQIPITDAFSGSLQEHLFAQNIVIAGNWLPYHSLKDKGIYYETIDSVTELKEKLLFVFENLTDIKNKVIQSNTAEKFKSSLWSECIKDWHSVIMEYKSNANEP
ncbi:glycosyltransferase [Ginsengibacter hankyongi]|uniref:Glycosyltransferase n=1 Tax=Ginsengibacter hankyongi TaxID=2607284 RepID=A0A5J5INH7_9BACT|nr:glycosyltransferase [Ginsengibacter hankyongi]KAA9041474.1 glycosyltransferase [Ginsengibacter hankyongi]